MAHASVLHCSEISVLRKKRFCLKFPSKPFRTSGGWYQAVVASNHTGHAQQLQYAAQREDTDMCLKEVEHKLLLHFRFVEHRYLVQRNSARVSVRVDDRVAM